MRVVAMTLLAMLSALPTRDLARIDGLVARRSAEAVRGILDRAEAGFLEVAGRGETARGEPGRNAHGHCG